MGNQVPVVVEQCGSICHSCEASKDGGLPCSPGLLGSEEFVETREVKQMHAWQSPPTSPRAGKAVTINTDNMPPMSPSVASVGTMSMNMGLATPNSTPQQVGVLVGLLRGLTGSLEEKTVTYDDGSTYTGALQNGQRHGSGVWKNETEMYDGEWQNDQQHGTGRQTWSDGRSYEGQYYRGHFFGIGKMVWKTPKGCMCYEGEYLDDMKHGMGKFTWADGRCYDGEWQQGKRHGRGAYTTAEGDYRIGYWSEDRFVRWEHRACEQDSYNRLLR
mmetsp:Transcript_64213/g.153307  ORF Transcript_64213/g.153307 Transcript_64213/m.153307 type:complete len:272 (+) Transcript_64213:48-863(+)